MNILILAGGLGTRLRSVIGDIPKPIAPINGHPFLYYLLKSIEKFDPKSVTLSLCYGADKIIEALKPYTFSYRLTFMTEPEALGTGGGIKFALDKLGLKEAIVLNGDTIFDIDLRNFYNFFQEHSPDVLLASRIVEDSGRYGALSIRDDYVIEFREKGYDGKGPINGGIYVLKSSIFKSKNSLQSFSFELFLKENLNTLKIMAKEFKNPFIDIGVPVDYERACEFLRSVV